MATNSLQQDKDSLKRTFAIGKRLRLAGAAVACTASLSVVGGLTPAVAQENSDSVLQQLDSAMSSGDVSVSKLAGAIANAQAQINELEGQMGYFREEVNRALVDLQDARTLAKQARRGTTTARSELETAQKDIERAQEKLNEISRAAYRRANTSEAVSAAAGEDSRAEMLERQTYLRTRAEEQQAVVDELDEVRTQKANRESELRKAQQLADNREGRAESAEEEARSVLADSKSRIEKISAEYQALLEQQEAAQAVLDDARGTPAADRPRRESTSGADAEENSQRATAQAARPTASNDENKSEEKEAQASAPRSEQASQPIERPSTQASEPAESGAQTAGADQEEQTEATVSEESGATSSNEELADFTSTVFEEAAAAVAASQPEHTQLDAPAETDENEQLPAVQDNVETPEEDQELVSSLDGVLEDLDSNSSVTEEASSALADTSSSDVIEAVIARGESVIGTPYAWGGGNANGPTKGIRDGGIADSFGDYNKVGFDCSGLIIYAFAAAGISLPHYSGSMYNMGTRIDPSEAKRGDLLFYGPGGSNHVAIYLGDGMMLESPQSGSQVKKSPVRYNDLSPYAVRLV